jgi:hypothetical protein
MYEIDHAGDSPPRDSRSSPTSPVSPISPLSPTAASSSANRPLSFVPSPLGETIQTAIHSQHQYQHQHQPSNLSSSYSYPSQLSTVDERRPSAGNSVTSPMSATSSFTSPTSPNGGASYANGLSPAASPPPPLQRHGSESAAQQSFPLNDIDYESSPAAVAQELSNLQAIRRMSMDVNGVDPDLPSFNPAFGVPSMAPSPDVDDEDPSRLFWVPARLHPELAPKEFKTFIQDRVKTLKRSSLSGESLTPGSGLGSLRRRKSVLSHQINDGDGYEDGAERLIRKQSQSSQARQEVHLHDLEGLVSDPQSLAQRMSLDQASIDSGSGSEVPLNTDMPILPSKPGMQTLKRSTRTQYRRGSLKKGGLAGRRQTLRHQADADANAHANAESSPSADAPPLPDLPRLPEVPVLPNLSDLTDPHFGGLTRVQTEPVMSTSKNVENFSRPGRKAQTPPQQYSSTFGHDEAPAVQKPEEDSLPRRPSSSQDDSSSSYSSQYHSRPAATNGRPSTQPYTQTIPEIVEPQPDPVEEIQPPSVPSHERTQSLPVMPPERSSSMEPPHGPLQSRPLAQRTPLRPQSLPHRPGSKANPNVTLDDIASHPAMYPGNSTRSDSLSVIPTYDDAKRSDKKPKSKEKSGWGWFSSSNNEEKEREKREKEERDSAKRSKSKLQKPNDNTRLDVLQTSIDGPKSRESGVFDRSSLHIEDDRKPPRKSSGGDSNKKEKDSGLFSSLFSSKKKTEKETHSKKASSMRGLSPDPPPRILRPDIDYNWSRFSILEERAIYRMAHIKLANPRRELYSQVLLSNFMYSYLAKVQQMHPQIQIPQSAAQKQAQRQERQQQKKAEAERQQQERQQQLQAQQTAAQQQAAQQQAQQQPQQQPEEFSQYQRYHEV